MIIYRFACKTPSEEVKHVLKTLPVSEPQSMIIEIIWSTSIPFPPVACWHSVSFLHVSFCSSWSKQHNIILPIRSSFYRLPIKACNLVARKSQNWRVDTWARQLTNKSSNEVKTRKEKKQNETNTSKHHLFTTSPNQNRQCIQFHPIFHPIFDPMFPHVMAVAATPRHGQHPRDQAGSARLLLEDQVAPADPARTGRIMIGEFMVDRYLLFYRSICIYLSIYLSISI